MSAVSCETCWFFRDSHSEWDHSGECRRYPPRSEEHPRGGIHVVFPKTQRSEWCGEFTPGASDPQAPASGAEQVAAGPDNRSGRTSENVGGAA